MLLFRRQISDTKISVKRIAVVLVPIFVFLSILFFYTSSTYRQVPLPEPEPQPEPEFPHNDGPLFEFRGIVHLRPQVDISSLLFHVEISEHVSVLKENMEVSLPKFQRIDLQQDTSTQLQAPNAATINVPEFNHVPDASHIMVGFATTLDRLRDSLAAFTHWASNTNIQFVVIVETPDRKKKPNEPSIAEVKKLYESKDIPVIIQASSDHYLDRYVSLLRVLHDKLRPGTRWVGIIDDDTFFPSMNRLLNMLANYDDSQPFYIGGISEDKWANEHYGLMGFGGAGIFLSIPLLQQLRPYADKCLRLPAQSGDHRIAQCIYQYSTTKLTWAHGLHQIDIHADVTGFYEAVRPLPISLHHWKSANHHDMVAISKVSQICGVECILQKFGFSDAKGKRWHMTNGFSIVKYSYNATEEASFIEGAMEKTWTEAMWKVPEYVLGPFKRRDERKVQYMMEVVVEDEPEDRGQDTGTTMTLYYVRRNEEGIGDSIIRVVWQQG